MELLSWMKKLDTDMSRNDLLELIDHMHGIIDALLIETREKEILIQEIKKAANE